MNEGYNIITIEDNVINGGFGSYVLMELNNLRFKGKFKSLGFNDNLFLMEMLIYFIKMHGLRCRSNRKMCYKHLKIKEKNMALKKKD